MGHKTSDKYVLVYQAGIANVFRVNAFTVAHPIKRNAVRVVQSTFRPCEWFCRGLAAAGAEVRVAACNMAGDIAQQTWTGDLDAQPFSASFSCFGFGRMSDGRPIVGLED